MKNVNYKSIPNCLRKYRKARGLNQSKVAEIMGLKSSSIISRWEKGICLPSSFNIFKLAVVYRTMVDALFIDQLRELKDSLYKKEEEILKNKVKDKNEK
jgi:transcriptional regulator with XRE-family HTH domain